MRTRAIVTVAILLPAAAWCWQEPTETTGAWEDLGVPVNRSRIYAQAVGRDTTGQERYYLGMTDAERAFVLALDPFTGAGVQFNFEGYPGQVWGLCAHSNGRAYASTGSGGIFECDAVTGEARFLGNPPPGEQVVWELYEASDGNLYGGTYPSAKLVRVNLAAGQVEDLGRIDPEQKYVRTIAVEGEYVYCGCGVTRPSVWAYHIPTGEKTQLLPDEAREGAGWGRAMKRSDSHVYVYGNGSLYWRISGLEMEPVAELPGLPLYELEDGTRLFAYDEAGPNRRYLAVTPDGQRHIVNFDYDCTGTALWDVFAGPDGRIYGNTHTPITLFAFDPATGETEVLGDPVGHAGQVYASTWIDGKLHMAAYSDCTYTVWDPAREWNFGLGPENNPRRLGTTSRDLQRAGDLILAPDGRHTIVAGLPGYGRLGGAVVIVEPAAQQFEVFDDVVAPQSPWSLCTMPDDDVIAIGTTLYSGTGTDYEVTPGRLVLWNWRTHEVVRELTLWEDEHQIDSLLRLGDELWIMGAPNGKIAIYDCVRGEIVYNENYDYGAGHFTLGPDGKIYAAMGGRVVRINPTTREHELLATMPGLGRRTAVVGGYLYGIVGMKLVRLPLD